jgi:2-polyprenyl-6-methoxyphenol hydroxylase-like FAD-dependent oxidoreductase
MTQKHRPGRSCTRDGDGLSGLLAAAVTGTQDLVQEAVLQTFKNVRRPEMA